MLAAMQRAQLYYQSHPGSPAAVKQPKLSLQRGTWTALLGQSIDGGIVGFGNSVEAALRAFDFQYLNYSPHAGDALAA